MDDRQKLDIAEKLNIEIIADLEKAVGGNLSLAASLRIQKRLGEIMHILRTGQTVAETQNDLKIALSTATEPRQGGGRGQGEKK